MGHGKRISELDASFLRLEKAGARLHAASVTVFDGPAPTWDELREHVESRLHLVPRFRQRFAEVPFDQGRPVWVDDPHFNLRYHLRHAGLPAPGSEEQLQNLAGRLFAQPLDRTKPLWEMWLVDRLGRWGGEREAAEGRFALIAKSHHALVDGISAVDITTVLFDTDASVTPPAAPRRPWIARPLPTAAQLLSEALLERATRPHELVRSARMALAAPDRLLTGARERLELAGLAPARLSPAPPTPLNVAVGPHRRYTWVDADLGELRKVKDALGGTVNDAVLAVVAGALGRYLRGRDTDTRDLVLRALVPISVHPDGNEDPDAVEIAPLAAPLPVGIEDPVEQYRDIRDAVAAQEGSLRAIGARELTELAGFASPTLMSQAARLRQSPRAFNLVVTNVPGPQVPLYLLGRRLRALYPVVPIADRQALGIAVMSYDGRLGFGLLADYDALPDLDVLADALRDAVAALASGASISHRAVRGRRGAAARSPRLEPGLTSRRVAAALAALVVAAAGAVALALVLNARDDATVDGSDGPGVARVAGARPVVKPGNVVLLFSDERLTAELRGLALRTGGEATPQLVAAGQAVIVRRQPGLRVPVAGLTSDRRLDASSPGDPDLRAFVDHWLGRR